MFFRRIFAKQNQKNQMMRSTDDYEDYMNIHEFYELFWDRVPAEVVSNMYIDDNDEFIKETTLSLYEQYLQDRITINLAATLMTEFMRNLFKHKPGTSNIVDNYYRD